MTQGGIFIAFGANLPSHAGEPRQTIAAAFRVLVDAGIHMERTSKLYRTPAWPDPAQPPFLNAVARVRSRFPPGPLMKLLHETETAFGRTRSARNAPRTLDLDLIDFEGRVQEGPPTLPHPRMAARAFVLVPLAEIAPNWHHPADGRSVAALIAALPPPGAVGVEPI